MFLIERLASAPSPRADLMPRQMFGGAGDLIRAGLVARALPADSAKPAPRRTASQLDLAFPEPARRKAG